MTAYIIFYIFLYFLYACSSFLKSNFFYISAIIFIVVFVSLRFMVGWDYEHYYNAVVYHEENNITLRGEYLTIFLVHLGRFYDSAFFYFFANAFIFYVLFYFVVKKYSINPWLSLFFFVGFPLFFLNSLSVVRTFTAIAFSLYAMHFMLNKKYVTYVALIFVAGFFHKSAFVSLVFPIFTLIKFHKTSWLVLLVSASFLEPYLNTLVKYLVGAYMPEYLIYLKPTEAQEGTKAILFLAGISLFFILFSKSIIKDDKNMEFFLNAYLFGVFIYLLFVSYGTAAHRLTLYATILIVFILPKFFYMLRPLYVKQVALTSVHLILLFFFFYTIIGGADTYLPYRIIF